MATDLGKVGMRMRGDWDSSAAYEVLDAVSYNGATYIAKQNVPANTTPTNTTYWQLALSGYFPPVETVSLEGSSIKISRYSNGMKMISFSWVIQVSDSEFTEIGVLSSLYRPAQDVYSRIEGNGRVYSLKISINGTMVMKKESGPAIAATGANIYSSFLFYL